jgi:hypothetical protein
MGLFMSVSEPATIEQDFAELARELAGRMVEAVDDRALERIPDEALGQIFGSLIRVFAAKTQAGRTPRPFARNSGIAITDVAICCTALMDSVGLSSFELGAWQTMSGLGKLEPNGGL